jgi:hypothetical protein
MPGLVRVFDRTTGRTGQDTAEKALDRLEEQIMLEGATRSPRSSWRP